MPGLLAVDCCVIDRDGLGDVDRVAAGIRYRVGPGDDFRTGVTVRYIRYKCYYRSDRAVVCFIRYYRDIWHRYITYALYGDRCRIARRWIVVSSTVIVWVTLMVLPQASVTE